MENIFTDNYSKLTNETQHNINITYKVIDVHWLEPNLVKSKMEEDDYFTKLPEKKEIVNHMLKYYYNHENNSIYERTDFLCSEKEKVCICNVNADDFRKVYDRFNYKPNEKYISWFYQSQK
jgi:glutathionylspermidine synthase